MVASSLIIHNADFHIKQVDFYDLQAFLSYAYIFVEEVRIACIQRMLRETPLCAIFFKVYPS